MLDRATSGGPHSLYQNPRRISKVIVAAGDLARLKETEWLVREDFRKKFYKKIGAFQDELSSPDVLAKFRNEATKSLKRQGNFPKALEVQKMGDLEIEETVYRELDRRRALVVAEEQSKGRKGRER